LTKPNNKNLRANTEKVIKEKAIKTEITRIKKLYKNLSKDKIKVLEGLLNEAAFMKITLIELRENILDEGVTELFEQGLQTFDRKRPVVDIYSTMVNRYANVMKQLIDMFPEEPKKEELDDLMKFVKNSKGVAR